MMDRPEQKDTSYDLTKTEDKPLTLTYARRVPPLPSLSSCPGSSGLVLELPVVEDTNKSIMFTVRKRLKSQ